MSDTVTVSVQLPRPPEGTEWVQDKVEWARGFPPELQYDDEEHFITIKMLHRRIKPKTVMVELTTETAKRFGNSLYNTLDMVALNDACRAALASNTDIDKREKAEVACGKWIEGAAYCLRPVNHDGYHSPRTECGMPFESSKGERMKHCTMPRGHEGGHYAETEKCGEKFYPLGHEEGIDCALQKGHRWLHSA